MACTVLFEYVDPIITTFLNVLSDVSNSGICIGQEIKIINNLGYVNR